MASRRPVPTCPLPASSRTTEPLQLKGSIQQQTFSNKLESWFIIPKNSRDVFMILQIPRSFGESCADQIYIVDLLNISRDILRYRHDIGSWSDLVTRPGPISGNVRPWGWRPRFRRPGLGGMTWDDQGDQFVAHQRYQRMIGICMVNWC